MGQKEVAGENDWIVRWLGTPGFGFMGPFVGSVVGIMALAAGAWVVNLFGLLLRSAFITSLAGFIFANLEWFFLAFLFLGYGEYAGRRYPGTHWISPVIASIGSAIVVRISALLLEAINVFAKSSLIASASDFLEANLPGIFVLVLVLGYALKAIHKRLMNSFVRAEQVNC